MKIKPLFKILLIIVFSLFALLLLFYLYERFLMADDYDILQESRALFKTEEEIVFTSVPTQIVDLDEEDCKPNYCIFNNCTYTFEFTCKTFEGEYDGPGEYIVVVELENRKPSLLNNKKKLKSWRLEKIESKDLAVDAYLLGLQNLLKDEYLWRVFSSPLPPSLSPIKSWFKSDKVLLRGDYLKSVYLLANLSEQLGDEGLHASLEKEIAYLNLNKDQILRETKSLTYPDAYILELIELGLNEDYRSLIDGFVIQENKEPVFTFDSNKQPLLLNENTVYTKEYLDMVRYSDYYRIFRKYEEEDLANYSLSKMIEIYNDSEFVIYGLCSFAYADEELVKPVGLEERLEEMFSNDKKELIEGNIYELLMCNLYAKEANIEINGLDNKIHEALESNTINVDGNSFIVRELSVVEDGDATSNLDLVVYNLLDNLMYLLYEAQD